MLRNALHAIERSNDPEKQNGYVRVLLLKATFGKSSKAGWWRTPRWVLLTIAFCGLSTVLADDSISFNRDIRPILSGKCFRCHGPDQHSRQAELRLDVRDSAVLDRTNGGAVVPGAPEKSQLIQRIQSADPDVIMPPPETGHSLTDSEKRILVQWIAQGAEYQAHWSMIAPEVVPIPAVQNSDWPRNEIDLFVQARLEEAGLAPSPEATRATLLRRASLDLTGLPPAPEDLDRFLSDTEEGAFERAVDHLLASPHYGERMAVDWLDVARYADTNGYFGDNPRMMWPWRDWIVNAFNRNMPFDEFSISQLAGDLLPEATLEDRIATGFNRNHMANDETGLIDEEYRVEYVADRLETTATTWMGLTVGCARCHDHKYDQISQREFYQLFAFFNNGPDKGLITLGNPPPTIEVPVGQLQEQIREAEQAAAAAEQAYGAITERLQKQIADWEAAGTPNLPGISQQDQMAHVTFDGIITGNAEGTTINFVNGISGQAATFDGTQHVELNDSGSTFRPDAPWTISVWSLPTGSLGCLLSKIEPEGRRRGLEILWQKGRYQINLIDEWGVKGLSVVTQTPVTSGKWHHLVVTHDGSLRSSGLKVLVDGQLAVLEIRQDTLSREDSSVPENLKNTEPWRIARRDSGLGYYGLLDELRILQHSTADSEAADWYFSERVAGITAKPVGERSASDTELLLDSFVNRYSDPATREIRHRVLSARTALTSLRAAIPTTLVMQDLPEPRPTSILIRGEYSRPGDVVQPDVPAILPALNRDAPRNRLGLAQWLVSGQHPLTARVAVNRLWQQCFGEGLVRTANDFGSQGEMPSHPELLDWLAVRFVRSGWDIKAMLKLIVTSATYRQSAAATGSGPQKDPSNLLLSRSPRFRLSAEMIRDQALSISGLLVRKVGGPSVYPYQPPGLWEAVSYNGDDSYPEDSGEGLWRRSLYTFIKRQAPPPSLLTFDGPTREKCSVRRSRTNTPLQALLLLNDVTYIEASRSLAAKVLSIPGSSEERLSWAFRRVTCRTPEPEELHTLTVLLEKQRSRFTSQLASARELIAVGRSDAGRELDPVQLASWTITMHTLLNLDEVVTRP